MRSESMAIKPSLINPQKKFFVYFSTILSISFYARARVKRNRKKEKFIVIVENNDDIENDTHISMIMRRDLVHHTSKDNLNFNKCKLMQLLVIKREMKWRQRPYE